MISEVVISQKTTKKSPGADILILALWGLKQGT